MDELREDEQMSDHDVQMAILATLLQCRDYLAVIAAGTGAQQADLVQEMHAQGRLMLDPPFLSGE